MARQRYLCKMSQKSECNERQRTEMVRYRFYNDIYGELVMLTVTCLYISGILDDERKKKMPKKTRLKAHTKCTESAREKKSANDAQVLY